MATQLKTLLRTFMVRFRRTVLQIVIRLLVKKSKGNLVRLGSDYGGWWVPAAILRPGTIVISAGVGEDTTFDEKLLAFGAEIWALDPTPRAEQHVQTRAAVLGNSFHFLPVGLWCRDETLRFYAPTNPLHVSHSILNIQQTATWFEADCWSLDHLLRHSALTTIDVLKLDIEGAEIEVINAMLAGDLRPTVLCVELDAPLPEKRTLALLRNLHRSGYQLAHAEGWNLLFLRNVEGPR